MPRLSRSPVAVRAAAALAALTTALGILSAAGACGATAPPTSTAPSSTTPPSRAPRLVILLVIDQWPEWSFEAKRPALTRGFARLLREGTWHIGQHPSVATVTAVGHALLGSGAPPSRSGILANEWWHRDVERSIKAVEAVDGTKTAQWLRVPGLGDVLAAASTGGKAVGVSLKERSAILPLGHTGTAIWYDHKQIAWAGLRAPAWLAAWNTAHPIAAHLHDIWTPLPETPALAGIPDDAPGELGGDKGFGPTFPHALDRTPDPADAIFATPLGNELVFDIATAAIDHEQLGTDDRPDLLTISLSSHDYIGHAWGQESWESWDAALRTDRRLADFLAHLDTQIGPGRWAMAVTSDHGASPMPETLHGGRIPYAQIFEAANRAAIAELGPGTWIASAKYPTLYLSKAALAQKPKDLTIAITKIVYALRSFPGLARVERTADFWGHCETRPADAQPLCLALDPDRSGEVLFVPAPGWVFHDDDGDGVATSHGSLHPYDRLVPLILLPPGRAPHTPQTEPAPIVQLTDVASILSTWLGIPPPSSLPPRAPPAVEPARP